MNYRTAGLVIDCLRSLAGQLADVPGLFVVVVDNDSGDGSLDLLNAAIVGEVWNDWVRVIPAGRNGGFACGNNVGIREALRGGRPFDYVLLLNPDTIAREGAVRALADFMDAHPRVGITGSLLENADGTTDCSAHTAPSPLGELETSARLGVLTRLLHRYRVSPPPQPTDHECDWVSGASLMVRREVVETVGGMDEGYFLYFEEVDFCTRVRRASWKVWFVPTSRVVHLEGASTGIQIAAKRRPRYWYDSRRRYFVKHFGVSGLLAADALWAMGRLMLWVRRVLFGRLHEFTQDPRFLALDLLWGDLRAVLTGQIAKIRREGKSA